ncbi:hypothetical protein GCM10010472_14720 [Pseudonocardia halophobica]|uniref:Uncharacterized protein n=2 Tax=Pseudonocardia halophobica TaxID=29401 RepID=A0A9W6L2T2_9PSEU|nr:hypothetical protein GCM10017577_29910 [Pseudonocardia halophobica]
MPSAPHSAPVPGGWPRSAHTHTTGCYWDVQVCCWHCPPATAEPVPPPAVDAVPPAEPAVAPV